MTTGTEDATVGSRGLQAESETLAQYLARAGRLPVLQGFALALQLLAALDASHRCGVVHGDIASANLRIDRAGRLVVLPPGPGHDRPQHDTAPDLFAAAVVTYELLTGASPFEATGAGRRNAGDSPRGVRTRRAELPLALDAVFARALSRTAGGGYRSARAFSEALQAAIPAPNWDRSLLPVRRVIGPSDAPPPGPEIAKPASTPVRPEPPSRVGGVRRPGLTLAGIAAVAALTAMLWVALTPAGRSEVQASDAAAPLQVMEPASTEATGQMALATAQPKENRSAAAPRHHARESHPGARRAADTQRPAHPGAGRTVHASPPGPDSACRQDFAVAPDLCTAFRCATSEYRMHPVCVRMHAEGARARAQLAESRGGP